MGNHQRSLKVKMLCRNGPVLHRMWFRKYSLDGRVRGVFDTLLMILLQVDTAHAVVKDAQTVFKNKYVQRKREIYLVLTTIFNILSWCWLLLVYSRLAEYILRFRSHGHDGLGFTLEICDSFSNIVVIMP